jgi:hypothetical protein
MVPRHGWGSRLPSRTACGLTSLSNRLTRQAGKLVRALQAGALLRRKLPRPFHQSGQPVQAGAQGLGVVCHALPNSRDLQLSRHGRLFSSLRVTAGLVFLAQLFAQAPLRTQAEDGMMI